MLRRNWQTCSSNNLNLEVLAYSTISMNLATAAKARDYLDVDKSRPARVYLDGHRIIIDDKLSDMECLMGEDRERTWPPPMETTG